MELKEIFPLRLKSARKMAGLSMDALVEKLNYIVSKSAIGKYENGQMLPESDKLIALANALNVKPDFFFKPFTHKLVNVEFRKKSNLPKGRISQIKEMAEDYLDRYIEIENLLGEHSKFVNPLKNLVIKDLNDVESAALELRKKLKAGDSPIMNLLDLLEDNGIKIFEIDTIEDFAGLSAWVDNIPVIVLNKKSDNLRKRFTSLHETAHLLLNIPDGAVEKLCHSFAGAFLIPEHILKRELGEKRVSLSFTELINVKETYGISVQALVMRANAVGIVDDNYLKKFFMYIRQNHLQDEKGLGNYPGIEQANRFNHMVYYAVAEDVISLSKGANLVGESLVKFRTKMSGK
jgi:Zn-dependent peptidase ImmA (M78 family)/DNA-binding XRE family transcriptional regulator